MKPIQVLIACEFSGVVREAFNAYSGVSSYSCDLLPAEDGNTEQHIQGDAIAALKSREWDLVIAHPPCTFLCNSGVRWLYNKDGTHNAERWANMREGARFFRAFFTEYHGKLVVENPIMHKHARDYIGLGDCERQTVQPWQFGHMETKGTVLWLRGMPKLKPTNNVKEAMMQRPIAQRSRIHYASPGPQRWAERSRTFTGIADAMAAQWVPYLLGQQGKESF